MTTTVRSIDAPFLYSTTKELKEQRQRAAVYASKLDGTTLPAVLNGDERGAPMWRGNLVRDLPFRAETDNSSIADLLASGSPEIDALTNEFMERLKVLAAKKLTERQ